MPRESDGDRFGEFRQYLIDGTELEDWFSARYIECFPGAVFTLSSKNLRLRHINRFALDHFKITERELEQLVEGNLSSIVHPASLRRLEPRVREIVNFAEEQTLYAIVRYRLEGQYSHAYVTLQKIEGEPLLIGHAIRIEEEAQPNNVLPTKARQFFRDNLARFRSLTTRERDVLRLVANGNKNRSVADILHISVNTVKTHKKNIIVKLKIEDPSEFVKFAIAYDLVEF